MDYKLVPKFNSDSSYSGMEAHVYPDRPESFKVDISDTISDIFDYVRTEIIDGRQIVVLTTKKVP